MKCQQSVISIWLRLKIYASPTANEKLKVRQIRCASKYITGRNLLNLSMLNDNHNYKLNIIGYVLVMPVMRIRILIGTTVVRIRILIGMTVVRIRILIGTTVVQIASVLIFSIGLPNLAQCWQNQCTNHIAR